MQGEILCNSFSQSEVVHNFRLYICVLSQHFSNAVLQREICLLHSPRNQLCYILNFQKPFGSHLLIEQPGGRKYQRDVENHVDHAGPIDCQGCNSVVFLQDAGDDHQLGPLEGIGSRVEDEHSQHHPSHGVDGVHIGIGLDLLLLSQL